MTATQKSSEQFQEDTARPDLSGRKRMRRYRAWRRQIELRMPNRGKAITDGLETVAVDPWVMDVAEQVAPPAPEGVPFFRNFWATLIRLEFPKWLKRGQFWRYFPGTIGPNFRMDNLQGLENRFRVAREKGMEPDKLRQAIGSYAAERGFALCGFTNVDRRFIADGNDEAFPYDTAVVLGMEMDAELLEEMPSPGERLVDFEVYVEAGRQVMAVAAFIRRQGYRCVARTAFNAELKYVPHAINAGLAELGANGLGITPQFGPRQRWAMISVDAEIEPDAPADFGIAGYCEDCLLCVHGCPGRALSEEKVWWRGVHKHKLNPVRCWPYFAKFDGCSICLKVCPLHRHGYEACMAAYSRDGTILGRPAGVDRFLKRRERARAAGEK